jgi:hypothetical protein
MTTLPRPPGSVRHVDGGLWDRLRRVDPRIWDPLLALAVVAGGVLAFALREHRPDEPPAVYGFALMVVAGSSLAWRRRAPLTVTTIVVPSRPPYAPSHVTGPSGLRTGDDVRVRGQRGGVTMRRLLIGLLLLGGAIAVIAVISRRRSGSGVDEWDSFAAGDSYAQASMAAAKATDAAKDA